MVKLNTDGSCLDNPGSIAAGGICRNEKGDMLFAFSYHLGSGTNNMAEFDAALFGLTWCLHLGFSAIHLELDSEFASRWINKHLESPWAMSQVLFKIHFIISLFSVFSCRHI